MFVLENFRGAKLGSSAFIMGHGRYRKAGEKQRRILQNWQVVAPPG